MKKILLMMILLLGTSVVSAETYFIDPDYTSVSFKIGHLSGYTVGQFRKVSGKLVTDEKGRLIEVDAVIDANSIDTRNQFRDEHLKSKDFFDVANFPQIKYSSSKASKSKITGELTLKGKTKKTALSYEMYGEAKDQFNRTKIALSIEGMIKRKDFGMDFNLQIDDGRDLLGEEVEITIELQGLSEKDPMFKRTGVK